VTLDRSSDFEKKLASASFCPRLPPQLYILQPPVDFGQVADRDAAVGVAPSQEAAVSAEWKHDGADRRIDAERNQGFLFVASKEHKAVMLPRRINIPHYPVGIRRRTQTVWEVLPHADGSIGKELNKFGLITFLL